MSECKYRIDGICVNADSPICADYCYLTEEDEEGICRFEDRGDNDEKS